ncbi:alpha/beta hydrolase family protein [Leekyejoonella antrihumi]|uniref:Acyl-peptide hydrolase n=1 Tax=Leekyejoonella antrihumi TaxID=1660198 RepID=A0A563DTV3_9MICO|nr:prolyl oligopeptidase family serine peptidase [Leekyejoonella antrihumi]TWP33690.1 S9 family peptidase [Leekyejoonella antrihumi]
MTPTSRSSVENYRARTLTPGLGRLIDITDIAPSPGGDRIAVTGNVMDSLDRPPHPTCHLIEVATGKIRRLGGVGPSAWSSDGTSLAYVNTPTSVAILDTVTGSRRSYELPGVIEYLRFAPRKSSVLAGVAQMSADRSGADGSGALSQDAPPLETHPVEDSSHDAGWRHAWRIDPEEGTVCQVSPPGWNVWEADWCAAGIVAVASRHPEESAWYHARIVMLRGPHTPPRVIARSAAQLGLLCASPDGTAIAYAEAICSDRGIVAGDAKILDLHSQEITPVDSGNVDVTSLAWRDESTLLATGQCNLTTVVAEATRDGNWRQVWSSEQRTCGDWYPNAVPIATDDGPGFAAAIHDYGHPPALTIVTSAGEHTLLDTGNPGSDYRRSIGGTLHATRWHAPDGLEIAGLLATPNSPPPHPLIVLIHGGPVAAYRPSWNLIYDWTPLLVASGYAVLHPNPRGSGGRGQQFASLVRGDMGGADTHDLISAVDALTQRGAIDPQRVAVTGRSYGGYMSAWLATQDDRWAAAIPMAPVTNWISQHFTTNINSFDEIFLDDTVTNPAGRFFSRSPIFFAERVRTPVLLIGGGQDRCTPPGQAVEFHHALSHHEKDSTLVIYPNEGHHINSPGARSHLLVALLDFLDQHMPAAGAPDRNRPSGSSPLQEPVTDNSAPVPPAAHDPRQAGRNRGR